MRTFLLLLLSLFACSALQAQPSNAISFKYRDAFLTGGDNNAQYYQLAYARQVHPLLRLSLSLGYLSSIDRNAQRIVEANELAWRDREHLTGDLAGHFDMIHIEADDFTHRVGLKMAVSYRYRWEELLDFVYLPGFFTVSPNGPEILAQCGDPRLYCFKDGENQYAFGTDFNRNGELGFLGSIEYTFVYDRFEAGFDVGYYQYRERPLSGETNTYYYGVSLGYRF